MSTAQHYLLFAKYNQRMNWQQYQAIEPLSIETINQDRGLFFQSILGTLNHLLVGDLIWLRRFGHFSDRYVSLASLVTWPVPTSLNDVIYRDFSELKQARESLDRLIINWLTNEALSEDFTYQLVYANTAGVVSERNFGALISHLFNHQTHHRGQLSTVLNQLGVDVGVTDFLLEIPDDRI
ncbi:DinB family protein [Vibrio scophthalmi]|uniref:DinB family protein n=1 Tax=Vibrio scophthalmi TaxID=45658 RepID=UPI003EB7AC73